MLISGAAQYISGQTRPEYRLLNYRVKQCEGMGVEDEVELGVRCDGLGGDNQRGRAVKVNRVDW